MGLFITFEGGEGSGKSTQAKMLYSKLAQSGTPVLLTHEPGGTDAGDKISHLLKQLKEIDMTPLTELMLFNASRAQHVTEIIRPNLEEGKKIVICDRYTDSTTTYQGYGRRLNLDTIKIINDTATGGLKPDLTVLLDISPEEGFNRISTRGKEKDRFEREDLEFHRRIREGYLKLVDEEPERWLVIDATLSKERIKNIIWNKVSTLIEK